MEEAAALEGLKPSDWMKLCFVRQPFVVHFPHWFFLKHVNYFYCRILTILDKKTFFWFSYLGTETDR